MTSVYHATADIPEPPLRVKSAALAVQEILPLSPCACDLLDRRHLSLARETNPEYEVLIPAEAEATPEASDQSDRTLSSLTGAAISPMATPTPSAEAPRE
jgi:hypothetical protein